MSNTSIPDVLSRLPHSLRERLACDIRNWRENTVGCSRSRVFHCGEQYLKVMPRGTVRSMFQEEKARLEWLYERLPVPEVIKYEQDAEYEYILISAMSGSISCDRRFQGQLPMLLRSLAKGLRLIHTVDIAGCPFDMRLTKRLDVAREYVYSDRIAREHGSEEVKRLQQLYEQLAITRPVHEDLVFTHGDYCLPNVLLNPHDGNLTGFIDWASGGVADRYHDLALACRSLLFNFPEAEPFVPQFLEMYGLETIDWEKLRYYREMDELLEV